MVKILLLFARMSRPEPHKGAEGMFERFTDRARRVVVLAQEESRLLNHNYIGTEHILLGLIREEEGIGAQVLIAQGVSIVATRELVKEIIGTGSSSPSGHIPFTPRGKKVLELSLREALQLGHNYIGTEHILLGLIREGEGVAAQALSRLGINLEQTRYAVIAAVSRVPGDMLITVKAGRTSMTIPIGLLDSLTGFVAWYEASGENYDVFLSSDHPVRALYLAAKPTVSGRIKSDSSEEAGTDVDDASSTLEATTGTEN